jgi:hypothetical protein
MANRLRNVVLGAVVLIAGVVGLFLPVSVFDGNSSTVACGNAVTADQSGPKAANEVPVASAPVLNQAVPHPDFVAACDDAISGRRRWAIPLTIVGAAGLVLGLFVRGRGGKGAQKR